MEPKTLSRNWKKLQASLQKEQPRAAASNPLKRRGADERPPQQANGFKRQRSAKQRLPPRKRPRMGSAASAPSSAIVSAENGSIPATDLPTASPFLPAPSTSHDTAALGKYVALDCEMVGVGPPPSLDSQLARVSLVNYHGAPLYDAYVLPTLPVTDYRTHVSGITPSHLLPPHAKPFAEVQAAVANLLHGRILVGHAIKNDLAALMLGHPRRDIRDTARHPRFRALSAGKAPSLKRLAKEVLGIEIQTGQHSSVEDAGTAMALFRGEKEEFEREHARRWGRPKAPVTAGQGMDGEVEGGGRVIAAKEKMKKKKKKGGKK